jgi:hypothetical protein
MQAIEGIAVETLVSGRQWPSCNRREQRLHATTEL